MFESHLGIIIQKKSEIMEEIHGLKAQAAAAAQRSAIVCE